MSERTHKFNIKEEWNFIKYEIHYNKPKVAPYTGLDLKKREKLFLLRDILIRIMDEKVKKEKNEWILYYNFIKDLYIKLDSINFN